VYYTEEGLLIEKTGGTMIYLCRCDCGQIHEMAEYEVTPTETLWFKRGHRQKWLDARHAAHGVDLAPKAPIEVPLAHYY
jgi:hypothetical protein